MSTDELLQNLAYGHTWRDGLGRGLNSRGNLIMHQLSVALLYRMRKEDAGEEIMQIGMGRGEDNARFWWTCYYAFISFPFLHLILALVSFFWT
jgi:hypothetical protein